MSRPFAVISVIWIILITPTVPVSVRAESGRPGDGRRVRRPAGGLLPRSGLAPGSPGRAARARDAELTEIELEFERAAGELGAATA